MVRSPRSEVFEIHPISLWNDRTGDQIRAAAGIDSWTLARIRELHAGAYRRYHNFAHALDVAHRVMQLKWENQRAALWAALFHDAVYEPFRKDNEARSQIVMASHLRTHEDAATLHRASRMVLATAFHFQVDRHDLTDDEAKFMDCDIAGLGSSYDDFVWQDAAITDEFNLINPTMAHDVKEGRRAFLERVLSRETVFNTPEMRIHFEHKARYNIRRLLLEQAVGRSVEVCERCQGVDGKHAEDCGG